MPLQQWRPKFKLYQDNAIFITINLDMKLSMITDQGDVFKIILTKMAGRIFLLKNQFK